MTFTEILSRGFTAANRIPAGWLLYVLIVGVPLWLAGPVLAALDVTAIPIRAVMGLVVAAYFAYIIMLSLAWGASLCLARRHGAAVEAAPLGASV